MKKNVLIIIPAYNEEGNIEAVLEQLEKYCRYTCNE